MTNNTQLKIRIRLDQSLPDQPAWERESESAISSESAVAPFDWRKISVAILLLLLMLAAISWALTAWFADDDALQLPLESIVTEAETAATELNENMILPESVLPEIPFKEVADAEWMEVEQSLLGLDPEVGGAAEESLPALSLEETLEPVIPIPKPGIKPEPPIVRDYDEIDAVIPNQSGHPSVVRAQLTSGVRQREPIDNINQITLAEKTSRPVFFFLHLKGFKDEKVIVDWFHRDQRIAKVTLQTGGDDWRTYSSKIVNKKRLGSWRVSAFDQSGNLLAERRFVVSR